MTKDALTKDAVIKDAPSRTGIVKRSLSIQGHSTSISLEDEFWQALVTIARHRAMSIAALVAEIDGSRKGVNLSSALRVFVLKEAQTASLAQGRPHHTP